MYVAAPLLLPFILWLAFLLWNKKKKEEREVYELRPDLARLRYRDSLLVGFHALREILLLLFFASKVASKHIRIHFPSSISICRQGTNPRGIVQAAVAV
jgi:hypothetical protein